MSDLAYTVSMPFKMKGKDELKESEFVLALAIDLNWFNPEQAKNILIRAEKEGLLRKDGELVRPSFDLASLEIPSGFKPQMNVFEKKPIFDRVIERIVLGTGLEKRKVISLINKKHEDLSKLVEIEVSAILVAMELGMLVDDLMEEEYMALTKPLPSS
jgi:hypothetical protein